MKKNAVMIGFGMVAAFVLVFILLYPKNDAAVKVISESTEETQEANQDAVSEDEEMVDQETVEEVVISFLDSFYFSAPPKSDEKSLELAVSYLSEGAKKGMEEEPTSSDLAQFLKVQDVFDEGYEINEILYFENEATGEEDGLAEVKVTLKYSGEDVGRIFQLSKTENSWQIDGVKLILKEE